MARNTNESRRNNAADSNTLIKYAAVGLAAATAGYLGYRFVKANKKKIRAAEKQIKVWVADRLEILQEKFELGIDQARSVISEVEHGIKAIVHLAERYVTAEPGEREAVSLAMEERFLEMKRNVIATLRPSSEDHSTFLRDFFSDLRVRLFSKTEVPDLESEESNW
jgi:hypothetical protein